MLLFFSECIVIHKHLLHTFHNDCLKRVLIQRCAHLYWNMHTKLINYIFQYVLVLYNAIASLYKNVNDDNKSYTSILAYYVSNTRTFSPLKYPTMHFRQAECHKTPVLMCYGNVSFCFVFLLSCVVTCYNKCALPLLSYILYLNYVLRNLRFA